MGNRTKERIRKINNLIVHIIGDGRIGDSEIYSELTRYFKDIEWKEFKRLMNGLESEKRVQICGSSAFGTVYRVIE